MKSKPSCSKKRQDRTLSVMPEGPLFFHTQNINNRQPSSNNLDGLDDNPITSISNTSYTLLNCSNNRLPNLNSLELKENAKELTSKKTIPKTINYSLSFSKQACIQRKKKRTNLQNAIITTTTKRTKQLNLSDFFPSISAQNSPTQTSSLDDEIIDSKYKPIIITPNQIERPSTSLSRLHQTQSPRSTKPTHESELLTENQEQQMLKTSDTKRSNTTAALQDHGSHNQLQDQPLAAPKRCSLPRRAKTKAIEALSSSQAPSIIHDFHIPQCIKGINVQVSRSTIPNSGLGLFLMQGNEPDGSVLPGTRVATYEGNVYTEPNDIAHVLSDKFRSQYLWGGVNPYTNKYTIVDAAPILSSHGRFINDGLDIEDANVELVFGTDGKLYVEAISVIPLFSEFFFSYGDPYWTDPILWKTLDYSTQKSVLNYYRCKPPETVVSVHPSTCPIIQLQDKEDADSTGKNLSHVYQHNLANITQTNTSLQKDETYVFEHQRLDAADCCESLNTINSTAIPTRTRKVKVTKYTRNTRDSLVEQNVEPTYCEIYGESKSGQTRLTIWHSEQDDRVVAEIFTLLKGTQRIYAPQIVRQYLLQSLTPLRLWKRRNDTHYYDSPPDGACGWYTLAQLAHRANTGTLLNLQTISGIQQAVTILNEILGSSPPCNREGLDNLRYAIEWISSKKTNDKRSLPLNRHMLSCDFAQYCHQIMGTLFIQPTSGTYSVQSHMRDEQNWTYLYSTSLTENESETVFTLPALESIASIGHQVILAATHFWLFPELDNVAELQHAIQDLAIKLWEVSNRTANLSFTQQTLTGPDSRITMQQAFAPLTKLKDGNHHKIISAHPEIEPRILPAPIEADISQTPCDEEVLSTHLDIVRDVEESQRWTDLKPLLQCYGKDKTDQTRLSLGKLPVGGLNCITQLLMEVDRGSAPQILTDHLRNNPLYTLNYWKKWNYNIKSSIPALASSWYTIAYLRWRWIYPNTLEFSDPDDRRRGADLLMILSEEINDLLPIELAKSLQFADKWLRGDDLTKFPDSHNLTSQNFNTIMHTYKTALFTNPGNDLFNVVKLMREDTWTRMLHNTISTNKEDYINYNDLTELAIGGNYAHVCGELFWPYELLDDELPRCHQAIANLAEALWDNVHNIIHSQLLSTPRSRSCKGPMQFPAIEVLRESLLENADTRSNIIQIQPELSSHLRVASLNVNGLEKRKLSFLLLYMDIQQIDILCIQDTRLDDNDARITAHMIRSHHKHINIQVRYVAVPESEYSNRVGGQMIIVAGRWASHVHNFYLDFTNLGIVTGITLKAQDHHVLILSTYWPHRSLEKHNNQLWNKVERHLHKHQIVLAPLEFIKHTIQERLKNHFKGNAHNVAMVVGDLNSSWGSTNIGGCHRGLQAWAQEICLSNPLHSHSLSTSNPIFTHWIGRHSGEGVSHKGVSWIDHILLHRHGCPVLVRGGTEEGGEWIAISDHRPIWAEFHLAKGGTSPATTYPTEFQPLRTIDRTNKIMVQKYKEKLNSKLRQLPDNLSPEEILQKLVQHSVQACPRPDAKRPTFYNCSRFKDGWSPMLVAKLAALSSIVHMRQHINGDNKRALWKSKEAISNGIAHATALWEQKLKKLTWDDVKSREHAYAMGLGPSHWRLIQTTDYHKLSGWLSEQELKIKRQLHGRQRSEDRRAMKNASAEREKSVASGKVARAIRSILNKYQPTYDLNNLKLPNGQLITNPIEIHDHQARHWKQWFSETDQASFFDLHTIDWSAPHEQWQNFMNFPSHEFIPKSLLQIIWDAIISPSKEFPQLRNMLKDILERPITMAEVQLAIKRAPSGSIPGPSGLSYAMMKEWPEEATKLFHSSINVIWEQKIIPQEWNLKWLCPKPKVDPEIATLNDLRPLNLLETPRKLLLGIIVQRITSVWETQGALSDSQYGFRQRRSCEGPTLQIINAQEEAEESGTEIHGSSWDIRRAFDSVPKSVLIMSWERLGVPSSVAKYIIQLDCECLTVPLTPHAKYLKQTLGATAFSINPTTATNAQGFYGETGTAQGDTPSPSNWTAVTDIPLRVLEKVDTHPFLVRTELNMNRSQTMAFADDIFSLSARKEGLQAQADVMSATTMILKLRIAASKLRATAKCWGQDPSGYTNTDYKLVVRDNLWAPMEVTVQHAEKTEEDVSFRYLGVQVDINNNSKQQFKLLQGIADQATLAAFHKQASPETIHMAIKLATYRKISFAGKFSPWGIQQLRQLDIPFNKLYRHHLRLLPSHPNATLYMPSDVGGIGLCRISDQINLDKWATLMRGIHSDHHTSIAARSLLNRCLRIGQTDTDIGYEAVAKPTKIPQLLRSLVEAMATTGHFLRRGGISTQHTPSQSIYELPIPDDKRLLAKLVNLRITTLADLMLFAQDGHNHWNTNLQRTLASLTEILPYRCPTGNRLLRVGQYWASELYGGQEGVVIEIMGIEADKFNGRRWQTVIPQQSWPTIRGSTLTWMIPCISSDSRGAGTSEWFATRQFFNGELRYATLSEEIPSYITQHSQVNLCVARALRSIHCERRPILAHENQHQKVTLHPGQWEEWITHLYVDNQEIEIFTDGSIRYFNSVSTALLQQPESTRFPQHVLGGILAHFNKNTSINNHDSNITLTVEGGLDIGIKLPSSIELYTILLAIHLLATSELKGCVYTDCIDAVHLYHHPIRIRNMGRKANFPLFEIIAQLLHDHPFIRLEHVKAHGPIHKQSTWTRAQWGNYYADRIAKGFIDEHAPRHICWPIQSLEEIVKRYSPWHWISTEKHILLEPILDILQRREHQQYLQNRDAIRINRGEGFKWHSAHYGLIADVWQLSGLSLRQRATLNRLLYDKGWHGGNRAKAKCPDQHTQEEWIGCDDCGQPDSQHHWIRDCDHKASKQLRNSTLSEAHDYVHDILTTKGSFRLVRDLFNICSEILHFAETQPFGEQVWLGILPITLTEAITPRLPDRILSHGNNTSPNRYRRTVIQLLRILAKGAQAQWTRKDNARRERLMGIRKECTANNQHRRRKARNQDIRVVLRRIAYKQAKIKQTKLKQAIIDIDNDPTESLLNDLSYPSINSKRLRRGKKTYTPVRRRWDLLLNQEYFSLNRSHTIAMQAKLGITYRKTIRRGTYDDNLHLDWLSSAEAVIEAEDGAEDYTNFEAAKGTIAQTVSSIISNSKSHEAIQGSCDTFCLEAYVGVVDTSCVGAGVRDEAGAEIGDGAAAGAGARYGSKPGAEEQPLEDSTITFDSLAVVGARNGIG